VIIVILVIALIAGYFLFVKDDSNETAPTPTSSVTVEESVTESP
jgi:hypothetical protein